MGWTKRTDAVESVYAEFTRATTALDRLMTSGKEVTPSQGVTVLRRYLQALESVGRPLCKGAQGPTAEEAEGILEWFMSDPRVVLTWRRE